MRVYDLISSLTFDFDSEEFRAQFRSGRTVSLAMRAENVFSREDGFLEFLNAEEFLDALQEEADDAE